MGMRIISWDNITERTYDLIEASSKHNLTVEPITTEAYRITFDYGDYDGTYSFRLVNNSGHTITINIVYNHQVTGHRYIDSGKSYNYVYNSSSDNTEVIQNLSNLKVVYGIEV